MSRSISYQAPFAPGGPAGIDADICRRLLEIALAHGGEYADLFFEYRAAGDLSFEEGITRSASRGVAMGLGVRVQRGDATGYAHVEDLSWEAMKRAAETAARIASGGRSPPPERLDPIVLPSRYELERLSIDVEGIEKRRLLPERASKAAHACDPRIVKVEASSHRGNPRDPGRHQRWAGGARRNRCCASVSAPSPRAKARESGRSGGGGRMTLGYFDDKSPEWHAELAARQALKMLDARQAPAGQMEVVLARATVASCCTRRSGMAWRRTSTARAPATTPARSARKSRASSARS
jgi:TldD protein